MSGLCLLIKACTVAMFLLFIFVMFIPLFLPGVAPQRPTVFQSGKIDGTSLPGDCFAFFTLHLHLAKAERQMMTFYRSGEPGVACVDLDSCPALTQDALWIDLFEPSQEEEKMVEAALGFEVPTREVMQ